MYGIFRSTAGPTHTREHPTDTLDGPLTDAIDLATEYAREHAERLGVKIEETPTGATFVTNNGSRVWYLAR